MNRTLKLIVYAATGWMTLVAVAVIAWQRGAFPTLPAPPSGPHPPFVLIFAPVWFALTAAFAQRRLGSERLRVSASHRRFTEGALKAATAFMVTLQGFYAYVAVTGAVIDRPMLLRGMFGFMGLFLAIQGNAFAKIDPPTGEGVPVPAAWPRTLLRYGWIMVVLGVANVAGAVALPTPQLGPVLIPVTLLAVAASVMMEVAYRHMTRPVRAA